MVVLISRLSPLRAPRAPQRKTINGRIHNHIRGRAAAVAAIDGRLITRVQIELQRICMLHVCTCDVECIKDTSDDDDSVHFSRRARGAAWRKVRKACSRREVYFETGILEIICERALIQARFPQKCVLCAVVVHIA